MIYKILLLLLSIVAFSLAQTAEEAVNLTENEHGFGIKAAAMGNAFTGIADDYSAIYWNPGGLAQLHKQQIYGSLNHLQLRTDATYLGNKTRVDQGFTKFQSFGYVYPFPTRRGSLVLALGYQRVKDLNGIVQFNGYNTNSNDLAFSIYNDLGYNGITLAFDRDFELSQDIKQEGHIAQWSIASAIDLSPNFSAGLTFNIIGGSSDYRLKYSQVDTKGKNSYDITDSLGNPLDEFYFNSYQIEEMVSTDYSGIEFKVGGLWHPNEHLKAGASITFPATISLDESWNYSDDLNYDIHILAEDQTYNYDDPYDSTGTFSYDIKTPFKFDLGLSYAFRNMLLAASMRYVDWTQLQLKQADNTPSYYATLFTQQNDRIPTLFRPVLSYSFGAQYGLFGNTIQLRGGYRYVPTPYKDVDKKADKQFYSAGIGFRVNEDTQIDLAFIHGFYETKTYYRYDWDNDNTIDPMEVWEKHVINKLQIGLQISL